VIARFFQMLCNFLVSFPYIDLHLDSGFSSSRVRYLPLEIIPRALFLFRFHSALTYFCPALSRYPKNLPEPIGTRRADFVVEDKILVELKATKQLEDVHFAQALNYLKVYKLEVGLLINFGGKSLEFKRLIRT
jgi:hypothetical protein